LQPSKPSGFGGKNPQLTKEQVARAMNVICNQWLQRQCGVGTIQRVAEVIDYHQTRNVAAMRSRGKLVSVRCLAL